MYWANTAHNQMFDKDGFWLISNMMHTYSIHLDIWLVWLLGKVIFHKNKPISEERTTQDKEKKLTNRSC